MTLECKYFELNGINLVQFTHRITDSTEPETPSRKEDNAAITGLQKDTGHNKNRR